MPEEPPAPEVPEPPPRTAAAAAPKPILKRAGAPKKRKKVVRLAVRDEALTHADEGASTPLPPGARSHRG